MNLCLFLHTGIMLRRIMVIDIIMLMILSCYAHYPVLLNGNILYLLFMIMHNQTSCGGVLFIYLSILHLRLK